MSKKTRQLVVFLSVLVVLVGCAVALVLSNKGDVTTTSSGDNASSQTSSDKKNPVHVHEELLDVDNIKITNAKDEYHIYVSKHEVASYPLCKIESLGGVVDEVYGVGNYILENLCKLYAQRVIGEVEDHMAYGLTDPAATCVITFKDGTTETITIGSQVPDGQYYYYIMREGDKNVYTAQMYPYIFADRFASVTTEVVNEITYDDNGEEEDPTYGDIIISSKDFSTTKTISAAGGSTEDRSDPLFSQYYKIEPGRYPGSPNNIYELQMSLQQITADVIAQTNPSQADLEKYGLADPYRTIEYTVNYVHIKLKMSKDIDGMTYFMRDDAQVIYGASTEKLLWAIFDEKYIHNNYVFVTYMDTIEKVTIENSNGSYVFDQKYTEIPAEEEGEEPSKKGSVSYKGKELIYNDWSKTMQNLLGVTVKDIHVGQTTVPADATPDLRVTFDYLPEYNRENVVVELFDLGNRSALYRLNGQDYMIVHSIHIDHINNSVQRLLEGKSVTAY